MRRHIPKAHKDLALHMSLNEGVSDTNIHRYIGISSRAMRRLRRTYQETGETIRMAVSPGRPRLLDTLDILVSHSTYLCSHLSYFSVP
jgi:transposase